jgi:two-component system sensor histidine kinase DegS
LDPDAGGLKTGDQSKAAPDEAALGLAARLDEEIATLDRELSEIDLLVQQARTEAERHEVRRAQAAEKAATPEVEGNPAEAASQQAQLVTLTRRAVLMEAQVDVLDGKKKSLTRFRDKLAELGAGLRGGELTAEPAAEAGGAPPAAGDGLSPAASRMVLSAQEDLRREIARAMHDGPAQSLTNIVLQAQIVDRLVTRDPAMAQGEVKLLMSMVQQTLDATKSFIFDVRPMVLDDLGLVPTLRRSARDRGRRAGVTVEFESIGQDRRLSPDVESGLFRILDEALAGYLSLNPERASLALDWSPERVEARVAAGRTMPAGPATEPSAEKGKDSKPSKDLPPALAEMVEDRKARDAAAAAAAREAALVVLPPTVWREVQQRAETIGVQVQLLDEGQLVQVVADASEPSPEPDPESPPEG